MDTVFARASATIDIATARPEAVTTGVRFTFVFAAILVAFALTIALSSRVRAPRLAPSSAVS